MAVGVTDLAAIRQRESERIADEIMATIGVVKEDQEWMRKQLVRAASAGLRLVDEQAEALRAIIIRCEEGDPRTDWLPTIARIARTAVVDGGSA